VRPILRKDNAAVAALMFPTLPGSDKMLSASPMMVEIMLVGSAGSGRVFKKARSAGLNNLAAADSCAKLVKLPNAANLLGLIEDGSCRTPTVEIESCTAGSWNTNSGTTLLRTARMVP
jgi:hypothetical protein